LLIILDGLRSVYNGYGPAKDKVEHVNIITQTREGEIAQRVIINGRIEFDDFDREYNRRMPNIGQKIELHRADWVSWFFRKTLICEVTTDVNGEFRIEYDLPKEVCTSANTALQIKFKEKRRPFAAQTLFSGIDHSETVTQIYNLIVPKSACAVEINLQSRYLLHPAIITDANPPPTTQWQSGPYFFALFRAIRWELPKAIFVSIFQKCLSGRQAQQIYDSFGPKHPKLQLTGSCLIDFLLNKIGNVGFTMEGDLAVWKADWDGFQFKDGREDSFPNIIVNAKPILEGGQKIYVLDSIILKFRGKEVETISAEDDSKIKRAIYLAYTAFALKGEAEQHLGVTHLLPYNIAIPFFKYIKEDNPIFQQMAFALDQLFMINWAGANKKFGVISGPHSSLSGSPVVTSLDSQTTRSHENRKSLVDLIAQGIRSEADWSKPLPQPLSKQDYFNHSINAYYNLLLKYYSDFINGHQKLLATHWEEFYRFSEAINQHLPESPCITSRRFDPQSEDFHNLAVFTARTVLLTTLRHWIEHSRQYLTDILSASFGTRNQALDANGNFAPDGNTLASDANLQLFVTFSLLNFSMDTFLDNEFGNIPDGLIKLFRENMHVFSGYPDVAKMMSATKI